MDKEAVLVTWIDPCVIGSWTHEDELELTFEPMKALGFLIAENEHGIAIAVAWDHIELHANGILIIPHACIIDMKKIEI